MYCTCTIVDAAQFLYYYLAACFAFLDTHFLLLAHQHYWIQTITVLIAITTMVTTT